MLTNANHILNKLDELSIRSALGNFDIICITESWLNDDIRDDVCSLPNYVIFRKDRVSGPGGGIICYVKDVISCRKVDILSSAAHEFELLWLALRPRLLPRPLTLILLCIVYCPPWYNCELRHSLCQYIVSSIDELNRKFPNAGIILAGDFNSLETNLFNKYFHFKQIVTKNTRGTNILDKIFYKS